MALSDYMPYGAPELLDGASPRMARSLFLAGGLVALLVSGMGLVLATQPSAVQGIVHLDPSWCTFLPPPEEYVPKAAHVPTVPKVAHVDGVPLPVPDAPPLEPVRDTPSPGDGVTPPGGGEPDAIRGGSDVQPARDPDPLPTRFIYTDELPQLVREVKPVYPDLAREAGVEGTVRLQLLVGLDGHVLRAIVRPEGSVPMLDEAAVAAALATAFTPALANGRPVKVWVSRDYRFALH